MLQLTNRFSDLIAMGLPRAAILWDITRTDGIVKRFTSHDQTITFNGNDYLPANSVEASAKQSRAGLKDENMSLVGAVDSVEITDADLRAGRYRDAVVLERLVDWGNVWLGVIAQNSFNIREVRFTGEIWEAVVSSTANRLSQTTGSFYSRNCRHDLGDTECGVTLSDYTESGSVSAVTNRRQFNSNVSAAVSHNNTSSNDNYFTGGKLTWLTGNNAGLISEVKRFTETAGVFVLQHKLPFDIQITDTFSVHRGCLKRLADCQLFKDYITVPATPTVNNRKNYGGYPDIPHTDAANDTPDFPESEE